MANDASVTQGEGRPKSRPGRKRLGEEVFVPVTVKVEPAELATIESIAKYSGRSRSDVMRQMLSYGLAHMMQTAFGGGSEGSDDAEPQSASRQAPRVVVGTYLPSYELDVIGAVAQVGRQSRSKVLRGAVEHALEGTRDGDTDE